MRKILVGKGIQGEDSFNIEVYKELTYLVLIYKNGNHHDSEEFWDLENAKKYINSYMSIFRLEKVE
jgi:hypothetical protein